MLVIHYIKHLGLSDTAGWFWRLIGVWPYIFGGLCESNHKQHALCHSSGELWSEEQAWCLHQHPYIQLDQEQDHLNISHVIHLTLLCVFLYLAVICILGIKRDKSLVCLGKQPNKNSLLIIDKTKNLLRAQLWVKRDTNSQSWTCQTKVDPITSVGLYFLLIGWKCIKWSNLFCKTATRFCAFIIWTFSIQYLPDFFLKRTKQSVKRWVWNPLHSASVAI